jgi:nucleotide-binding universal stress UspA family protein
MKTILVPATGFPSDSAALETAYLCARPFDGHIECLHVQAGMSALMSEPFGSIAIGDGVPVGDYFSALALEESKLESAARRAFSEFCQKRRPQLSDAPSNSKQVTAEWREIDGFVPETIIREARFRDLIVLGRAPAATNLGSSRVEEILLSAGRPILLAPIQPPENLGAAIAIAWKETPEAARAVTAAMPLLGKAEKIVVLGVEEHATAASAIASCESLAQELRWNGFKVETCWIDAEGRSTADALIKAASANKADMLVMGGYGHARLREFVIGGVTRAVIRSCPMPALLCH